eukprot:SAG31_NODE_944_length_10844_cov_11.214053_3_plen_83_part_00
MTSCVHADNINILQCALNEQIVGCQCMMGVVYEAWWKRTVRLANRGSLSSARSGTQHLHTCRAQRDRTTSTAQKNGCPLLTS